MIRSKKDKIDLESNAVKVKIGKYELYQDVLSFKVYDDENNEYLISDLLQKILDLETENFNLKRNFAKVVEAQNSTDILIVKAHDIMSLKISQLEDEVQQLKDKTKYL